MKSSSNGERAPLRTILQNFLNHVETLEKRKNEGDDQYDKEFQELKLMSESLKGLPMYSCNEGEKEVNRRKNRYKDILPFDCSRVSLSEITGIPGSDYINANYIRGASGSQAYIASQGPLVHTVTDFWRMVVECDVQVIIMACNEEESGKHKCECYWSEIEQETKSYGPYNIKLLKSRRMCNDFNLRTMELNYVNAVGDSITRTVVQFHYWAWPDHGVPALVRPLLDMVRLIRDCQASETLPLLIHCSAGCGRTGTICAIDYVWGLLRAGKLTDDFSLFDLVADMRRQRVAMVQTKDQYILVHRALRELFIEQLKMIDAHPYENLDVNGHPLICSPREIRIDPSYETIFVKVNSNDVMEVNEEDDFCQEESIDQIPWPVLQYQSSPAITSVPPLPDKKRKPGDSSDQESPVSTGKGSRIKKSSYDNISSSDNSKESSPPTSLERLLLKSSDTEPSSDGHLEEEETKQKVSPKSGLIRKSSILKIRAFFEKSHSEPRNEKKTKSLTSGARKANSFRMREESSKFYQSLDNDVLRPPATNEEFRTVHKLSLVQGSGLDIDGFSPPDATQFYHQLPFENSKNQPSKPSLPVKRSKSMKVYRGFDIRLESDHPPSKELIENAPQVLVTSPSCDVVLSKTPSITYISSKDHASIVTTETVQEPVYSEGHLSCNYSTPLATSSLDRGREQRCVKTTSSVTITSTGGSLDRSVIASVQSKAVPTYVNVLMRNQEAANSPKLDDDTRQLLHDCQTYLMHGDESDEISSREKLGQRSVSSSKCSKDHPMKERRQSYKNAVVQDNQEEAVYPINTSREEQEKQSTTGGNDSEANQNIARTGKKIHEYEAIWLRATDPFMPMIKAEIARDSVDNGPDNNTKDTDSIFHQNSEESQLFNEARSVPFSEKTRQSSPISSVSTSCVASRLETVNTPRLHPDRVLSELQELVERANRSKEEAIQSEATLLASSFVSVGMKETGPTSPSINHKSLHLNSSSPATRIEVHSPSSPAQFNLPVPSSISSIPSPGLITPIPIKMIPSAPCSPVASSHNSSSIPFKTSSSTSKIVHQPHTLNNNSAPRLAEPLGTKSEPKAPAFRPPPPYPTKLYVKLPPLSQDQAASTNTKDSKSPNMQRRLPPEYKAPPPVQRPTLVKLLPQPVAPPRSKRQVSHLVSAVAFPKGPPVPTRSFASSPAPGIDVDAVAAVMAAAENSTPRTVSTTGGSSSPTTTANKALSKALGKFHATAASFKTKLAQFGDGKDGATDSSSQSSNQPKMERESSFVKPSVYVDGGAVVNTSEATSYVRKKQQYL